MSRSPALVYLEADDEITGVVRRVRVADGDRVVVVAPGRSRATSSAVALRLLARAGADAGREVAVVGDALTRSLAAEAGLPAYASVDDARAATPGDAQVEQPAHAAIHVVRGSATDDTVAASAIRPVAAAAPAASVLRPSDETWPVPVAAPRPASAPRPARRRSLGLAAVMGTAGALLVVAIVAGAALLPAATITITPLTVPLEGTYEVAATPERHEGTVEASATVTATGSYDITEPAAGSVLLFNWTFFPVDVPAGTFVAAGRQAFATQAAVTVPRGRLTPQGTIAAGEQPVAVLAAEPGPAGNVAAGAIDTVVNEDVDARLRGFPENPEPRVVNPEPTAGGSDDAGTEITEEDVAAAVQALRADLAARAEDARPDLGGLHLVGVPPAEPQIDVPDDLAGTRDVGEIEITGSQSWEVVAVDLEQLEMQAAERFASGPAVPDGHELLLDSIRVNLGEPLIDGDRVIAEAVVTGTAAPQLDPDMVRGQAAGRTASEAEVILSELGSVDVLLWPGWVASVPELDWRVDVRIAEPGA